MTRRMSCSMTVPAVLDQTKTVTRRHLETWANLMAGDRLTLIEKGMGLPKGAKQVVLAEVVVVSNRLEMLSDVTPNEVVLEGLAPMSPDEFRRFWADGHGYGSLPFPENILCRRIEWRYINEEPTERDSNVI